MTATEARKVALVYLDRPSARGGGVRVRSWRMTLEAAGIAVDEIAVPIKLTAMINPRELTKLLSIASGNTALESIVWSRQDLRSALRSSNADAAIFVTARLWDVALMTELPSILDFVDCLSKSYRDRSDHEPRLATKTLYRILAWTTRRLEQNISHLSIQRVVAGWTERQVLLASWIPITTDLTRLDSKQPDHDAIFFGSLHYPPNIGALRFLASIWPEVQRRRPGTTLLVAGATPTSEVRQLVTSAGWELIEDFADIASLCNRARIAVAPLPFASGMQIKVLEAAALGLPQVVTPVAAAGLEPGFPVCQSELSNFATDMIELLDDEQEQRRLADAAYEMIELRYRPAVCANAVREFITGVAEP